MLFILKHFSNIDFNLQLNKYESKILNMRVFNLINILKPFRIAPRHMKKRRFIKILAMLKDRCINGS